MANSVVVLFADSRVRVLLWFVIFAVAVAVALILIEVFLRRKKARDKKMSVYDFFIERVQNFFRESKTGREKLDFLDKTAKEYFAKMYGMSPGFRYSALIEKFEKSRKKDEADFCKEMFASYYSVGEMSDVRVEKMKSLFVDVVRKKRQADESLNGRSFLKRFFERRQRVLVQKKKKIELKNIRRAKKIASIKRKRDLKIMRKKEAVDLKKKKKEASKRKRWLVKGEKIEKKRALVLGRKLETKKEKQGSGILRSKRFYKRKRLGKVEGVKHSLRKKSKGSSKGKR